MPTVVVRERVTQSMGNCQQSVYVHVSIYQGKRAFVQRDCGLRDVGGASMLGHFHYFFFICLFPVLPRQTIFYDIVEYLYSKKLAPRLKEELPALLLKPVNEDTKLEQIRIISEIRQVPML